jgi:uncharacterized membrane protein (DUF2068 family)
MIVALVADGAASLVEAWALSRGHWWGPWLVVATTSALLPFELVALARHPHVGRFVVLAINAAIVAYLVVRTRRERQELAERRDEAQRHEGA